MTGMQDPDLLSALRCRMQALSERLYREYNDTVIFPDKVRLNLYYLDHYSFVKDFQMILCTVFGKKMEYNGEII